MSLWLHFKLFHLKDKRVSTEFRAKNSRTFKKDDIQASAVFSDYWHKFGESVNLTYPCVHCHEPRDLGVPELGVRSRRAIYRGRGQSFSTYRPREQESANRNVAEVSRDEMWPTVREQRSHVSVVVIVEFQAPKPQSSSDSMIPVNSTLISDCSHWSLNQ